MKKIILLLMVFIPLILNAQFFVAVDGADNNPGTFTEPWGTWNKAFKSAQPGDTIYIRGGVYYSTERIGMQGWTGPRLFVYNHPIGTVDSGIVIMGYPPDVDQGNIPILDCSQHCDYIHKTGYNYFKYKMNKSPYNVKYNSAIVILGTQYLTLKDFKVRNIYQCDGILSAAILVIGNNITYENISIENVGQIGFHHISTSMSLTDLAYMRDNNLWSTNHEYHMLFNMIIPRTLERPLVGADTLLPAYWNDTVFNRHADSSSWKNCDVSYICDTLSFTHHDLYHYYIFEGDTLYATKLYSQFNDFIIADTGIFGDAWKVQSFNGNYYSFEGCRAWNYVADGFDVRGGKILFKNCWTMPTSMYEHFNKSDGFVTSGLNSNLLANYDASYRNQLLQDTLVRFENCLTLYATGEAFKYGIGSDVGNNPVFYNNTSYGNHIAFSSSISGSDTIGTYYNNIAFNSDTNINILSNYYGSHNTWDSTINITNNDFVTVDSSQLIALFTSPRNSDFSLPDTIPLMLSNISTLIDSGKYVGIDYYGDAPDIGYSESDYQFNEVVQSLELVQGWNIVSFYVQPDTPNIINIVNPLIEDSTLIKIMDEAGNFVQNIDPFGWLNTIGDMENTEGYYINVNDSTSFDVTGYQVNLPYKIELQAGWNILGYPLDTNQDAMFVLQTLISNGTLIKVQDESGNFIQDLPGYGWTNTIGDFNPDNGYIIKVSSDDTLTYQQITKSYAPIIPIKIIESECFTELQGNPFMAMNIMIEDIKTVQFNVEEGDELSAYDDTIFVGSAVIDLNNYFPFSIVARADDPITPNIQDGFIDGNPIEFRYCDVSEGRKYPVKSRHIWGDEYFTNLGTCIRDIRVKKQNHKDFEIGDDYVISLSQNYPNPFSNKTTIEYEIAEDGNVLLVVFDMFGRVIKVLENSYKTEGFYYFEFNYDKSGIYFYKLIFNGVENIFTDTKKMVIY